MFNFFKKGKKPENLKDIFKNFKELEEKVGAISKELKILKEKNKLSIQKAGIVRFNPFSGVGGNQSFSIALLDENNDGLVISSLYTREGNRLYAKPIKDKESEYTLSDEEKEAINQALGGNIKK